MHTNIVSKEHFLSHWQGHNALTRRVIDAFPEKDLFTFSIGGMRPFAELIKEILSIDVPGLDGILNGKMEPYDHHLPYQTKAELLSAWDTATSKINELFSAIPEEKFPEKFNLFGQFDFPIIDNILYFIDNQVHHRGQGYVYLRALGIEPPFFWQRQ